MGTAGYVHYGVEMGDGGTLETDSFLMKGETTSAGEVWAGNPPAGQPVDVDMRVSG